MKSYLFLFLAIISEVCGTSFLKRSEGFTKFYPSAISLIAIGLAFYLMSLAIKTIPIGTAYAIWAGAGIVLITLVGIFLFKQVPDLPAIAGMILIIAGVVLIQLFSKTEVH